MPVSGASEDRIIPLPPPPSRTGVSASSDHSFSCPGASAVGNSAQSTANTKIVSLDDLFGPPSSSPVAEPPPSHHTHANQPMKWSNDAIHMLFSAPSGNPTGSGNTINNHAPWGIREASPPLFSAPTTKFNDCHYTVDDFFGPQTTTSVPSPAALPVQNMIYVDDSTLDNRLDENEINLMDLHPSCVETTQFQSPESYLDAFECRRGRSERIGNESNSLEHLTRNRDGNKVKARLLSLLNHYEVLGVPRDALPETIKRRYRVLAMNLHPDKTVGIPRTTEEEDLFKAITAAYEVLSDEDKRREYDEELHHKEDV